MSNNLMKDAQSLIIREMQIKNTVRYYFAFTKTVVSNKNKKKPENKC